MTLGTTSNSGLLLGCVFGNRHRPGATPCSQTGEIRTELPVKFAVRDTPARRNRGAAHDFDPPACR